ncbi:AAA family ATPase, partial [bacterium]|nr:AAA family ATPase [bacterium]
MKILNLEIQGYRSLRDIIWVPGNLNVLIGPNGCGKSNLLRALEMISISAKGQLGKCIQRSGGIDPLLWDGKADSIKFSVKISPSDENRDVEKDSLTYDMTIERIGKGSTYRIAHELLGNYYQVENGQKDEPFKMIVRDTRRGVIFDENERSLVAPEESIIEEESLLSMASGPFTHNRHITPFQAYLAGW